MASGAGFSALMGMGIGMILIIIAVWLVVGTLILMFATKMVEKWTPTFVKALVVTIVCGIVAVIVHWVLRMVLGFGMLGGLITLVANFLITAAIIQQLLTRGGGPVAGDGAMAVGAGVKMAYGRACLITLVEYVIAIILGIIFGVIFGVMFGGAMLSALHQG